MAIQGITEALLWFGEPPKTHQTSLDLSRTAVGASSTCVPTVVRFSCHIDATLFVMAHAPASPRLSIDPQDARGEGQPAAGFFDHAVGFGRGPVAEEQHPHVVAAEP